MENKGVTALSELAETFRNHEDRQITKEEFKAVLRQHLTGSHADQQITQLWDKLCRHGTSTIGQEEVCTFLLHEMQQRESQTKAHFIAPLPHHPSFSSMTNTKETVCGLLTMSSPPQYLTVSKDGCLGVWSMRFQLQQATSLYGGRRGQRGSVWVTSCVMVCGKLVVATTSRELSFYDTVSFSCLHRVHKLPCVPLCMVYGSEEESCTGHLVWGDENGCVGILSFSEPNKSLFHSALITFGRLSEHAPRVKLRYEHVHTDWVCQVGWTGPAHCIISAARSSTPSLLIQHVCAQRKKYSFKIRMGVSCFAHSHKLEVLATGSLDHIVRLWTPFSPQYPVACLSSHLAGIVGIAIAEQPQYLLSLAQDLSLCVWDVMEHHLLQTVSVKFPFTQRLPDFGPSPLSLLTLPSPTVTVSCNEYIARFSLRSGAQGTRVDASHSHPVCAVVYCPLLDQLVSGCEGGEVKVWEVTSGRCVMKVEGCHGDQELTALAVDSGGSRILTGSRDGTVKVWESLTGQCLQSLATAGDTEVSHILHHTERRRFLATGWNRTISVFEDKTHGLSPALAWNRDTPHGDDIIAMDYCSPHYLATGSFDGLTVVWNTDTERIMTQFHSMTKIRHSILSQKRSRVQLPNSSFTHSTPTTPSRPVSRRLSAYHLKSASSSHLYHVPVDQVLFLEPRLRRKVRGQATLVTSEGGHAHFWDIFSTAQPLGRFPLTPHEEEVVLALATDDSCQWLLAGDTAGHLSLFNIAQYCITPQEDDVMLEPECTWRAHISEILSVAWAGPDFLVSASADHTVQMWTIQSKCVGYFGQPQLWSSANPATFQHAPSDLTHPSPGQYHTVYPHPLSKAWKRGYVLSTSTTCIADVYPEVGEGEEGREWSGKVKERRVEEEPIPNGLESPAEELTTLKNQSLGIAYQAGVSRRMAERLERRTHYSEVDTSSVSPFAALFSPFQALHVPAVGDVTVPQDVTAAVTAGKLQ